MSNEMTNQEQMMKKRKKRPFAKQSHLTTLLLAMFLGNLGVHRFYTGHTALGIVQLLTLGGCGVWTVIDFIRICFNDFKNSEGLRLREYNKTLGLTMFYIWLGMTILSIIINATTWAEILPQMQALMNAQGV